MGGSGVCCLGCRLATGGCLVAAVAVVVVVVVEELGEGWLERLEFLLLLLWNCSLYFSLLFNGDESSTPLDSCIVVSVTARGRSEELVVEG